MITNNKKNKKRMTHQKIKILEHLKSVTTHPTAEMVYKSVLKELPHISLATVYRNLNSMADENKILKFEVNNESHYDGDICDHQHAVCKTCGKIIDIFQKEISEFAMVNVKADNFKPICSEIIFKGYCDKCSGV